VSAAGREKEAAAPPLAMITTTDVSTVRGEPRWLAEASVIVVLLYWK
jgi:hypothetical protein